jgi:hypothetical protein
MDLLGWVRKHLGAAADTDLLREMVLGFAQGPMGAEADALCGSGFGERSPVWCLCDALSGSSHVAWRRPNRAR